VKICIIGNLLYEKEIIFMSKQLEKKGVVVYCPTLDDIKEKKEVYIHILNKINDSDLILLIYKQKNESDFIFYFGVVFGLKKKFKTTSVESIRNLINYTGESNGNVRNI
jgi:hypothetical protein